MCAKIATDKVAVQELTNKMKQHASKVSFTPRGNISYSSSVATTQLKSCLKELESSITTFKSSVAVDIENLTKIHQAIEKNDQEWGAKR